MEASLFTRARTNRACDHAPYVMYGNVSEAYPPDLGGCSASVWACLRIGEPLARAVWACVQVNRCAYPVRRPPPTSRRARRRTTTRRATARIGVATSDLFPRFSLTGSFGLQSQELGDLPEGDSRLWNIGPSVPWPILDFGRIRSNIKVQDARAMQAAASYEGTVLDALSDVEVALVAVTRERRRNAHLQEAADQARNAVSGADELHKTGLLDYTDLLDAQRTLYDVEDELAQNQAVIAQATVRPLASARRRMGSRGTCHVQRHRRCVGDQARDAHSQRDSRRRELGRRINTRPSAHHTAA